MFYGKWPAVSREFDVLATKTEILLLKAIGISHLHYSSVPLNGISQSLNSSLEKQGHWGIKACFNRYKMDSAHDLRLQYRILTVRDLLDFKADLCSGIGNAIFRPLSQRFRSPLQILKEMKEHSI